MRIVRDQVGQQLTEVGSLGSIEPRAGRGLDQAIDRFTGGEPASGELGGQRVDIADSGGAEGSLGTLDRAIPSDAIRAIDLVGRRELVRADRSFRATDSAGSSGSTDRAHGEVLWTIPGCFMVGAAVIGRHILGLRGKFAR
jgi:hypothetical protein